MTPENIAQLRKELARDEGKKLTVYLDTEGLPTVGIGHLIKPGDLERGKPIGYRITEQRCVELFQKDLETALKDVQRLVPDLDNLPEVIQRVLANMMFNLGYTRLSKFRKMIAAVNSRDWEKMAKEMMNSKWATQVGKRADRLVALVKQA